MTRRAKFTWIGGGVVAVLVAVAGLGLWWFLRDDSPPEVDLATAVGQVSGATSSTDPAADGTGDTTAGDTTADEATAGEGVAVGGVSVEGVTGDWVVDTDTGELDSETATGSFVGFRIEEELASIGSTTAVGRTGDVAGTMTIDGTTLGAATFEVDLTTITTNESRRDDRVQQALETSAFPTATFTLTAPVDLGDAATTGEPLAVTAVGDLTIHGVTQSVAFALEAQLVGDTIVVVGSAGVTFSDYGVEVPEAQVVLSVEDHGTLELQFLLVRA